MVKTLKVANQARAEVAPLAGDQQAPEGLPAGVDYLEDPARADVAIAFVRRRTDLTRAAKPALDTAGQDRLAWIAYPKAGKLILT